MNNTIEDTLTAAQYALLNRLAHSVNSLGMNLLLFNQRMDCIFQADGGRFATDAASIGDLPQQVLDSPSGKATAYGSRQTFLGCCLAYHEQKAAAVIDMGSMALNDRLGEYCRLHQLDEQELLGLLPRPPQKSYPAGLLESFAKDFTSANQTSCHLEKLTNELSHTYEQIVLLYNLSTHMKVTQSNAEFLQYACDQLSGLINVEGLAIYLEKKVDGQKRLVLTAGCGYVSIDAIMAGILQMHLTAELTTGKEALLDSGAYGPFKYSWNPNVRSLIAVPLAGGDKMIGFLVATNALNKPDFDSTDIKMFNSIANQCAVFIENGRLFADLKDLFIGSLKALTSSIDAKDQYTRGHSERVAFIARWIAEHLHHRGSIDADQIHYVYLAGLLHDIGKIGVSEAVLRKRDKLTDEERAVIIAHPRIGAAILSEISQMRQIVDGVLHHHERYDGKGYPHGLAGLAIPLAGRIIALADSFDAMTSKRVYRDAMSLKRALAEIEKGKGTQFDPEIVDIFLDSDIEKLWHIIQDGFIETWDYSNFGEFGAKAVGVLLR